ncbi:MAG: type I-G CRISPR-associated helicase/endonuclease Cas3g [Ancrocorticia sp.]|uniref:type I-G CRISPR-associated helicase/endonuclease Cas3g n=1 Tax=Ancrocorticia sp. TaxID=2593684 RepID=UPI003F91FD5F
MSVSALDLTDFDEFFAAVNHGNKPFSWQRQLCQTIAETGQWPSGIVAPTSAGKSSVVDIHIFLNAWAAAEERPRIPRRLSCVVNRRALVDNQAQHAEIINRLLERSLGTDTILGRASHWLRSLRSISDENLQNPSGPVLLGHLRGQLPRTNDVLNDPCACGVIAATPDMFGSRLLFQGYGSTPFARPREAALLAYDNVLVLDESQLSQQLLCTSRAVRDMTRAESSIGLPTLQVVATTATPGADIRDPFTVDASAFIPEEDHELITRYTASKQLSFIADPAWIGKTPNTKKTRSVLVDEVLRLLGARASGEKTAHTVGCIVNHVQSAVDLYKDLRAIPNGPKVELLVGRMRPWDVDDLIKLRHPDLLTIQGDPSVDVIVATQTLEVGLDIDFASLVTELAPASSLIQRFGRVNRLGKRVDSEIVVVGPEGPEKIHPRPLPYTQTDLQESLQWLVRLAETGSASPQSVAESGEIPATEPNRLVYQRPEIYDVDIWSRTSDARFADDDLDLWLHDSLDTDTMAGIAVCNTLPLDDQAALSYLKELGIRPSEVFPCRLSVANSHLKERSDRAIRSFLLRNGEVTAMDPNQRSKPGDVLIFEDGAKITSGQVCVEPENAKECPRPVPFGFEGLTAQLPGTRNYEKRRREQGKILECRFVGSEFLGNEELTKFAPELGDLDQAEMLSFLQEEISTEISDFRTGPIITNGNGRDVLSWVIAKYDVQFSDDDLKQQERSQTRGKAAIPTLEAHNGNVSQRSLQLCENLGILPEYQQSVAFAAQHHDDGKSDPRFQWLLVKSRSGSTVPVAKGNARSQQEHKSRRSRCGLPSGWRHELYSVIKAAALDTDSEEGWDELGLRLIGTSHGHNRSMPQQVSSELLSSDASSDERSIAAQLLDSGFWDSLMDQTNHSVGHWAASMLEAVLRAADCQISMEGK